MAELSAQLSPTELETQRNRKRVFYPVARIDIQAVFEDHVPETERTPRTFRAIPRSVSIHRNSYNQADTWQVTFNLQDFPITPEAVRAGAIELRLFELDGAYEEGVTTTVLTDDTVGIPPTIVGLFDDMSVDLSEQGKTVSISGTDYTALFLNRTWSKQKRVTKGLRLDVAMKTIKDSIPGAENMRIAYDPARTPEEREAFINSLPIVGQEDTKTQRQFVKITADNYWDAMFRLAQRYGYIIFVRGLELVLAQPKNFIEGRTEVKKLAWGENLTALRMSRKLGRQRTPVIRIRGYNDVDREPIVVEYPRKGNPDRVIAISNLKSVLTSEKDTDPKVEIKEFFIPGIKSRDVLQRAAESYFHLVSRSEQQAQAETRDLVDLEGQTLMDLRAGDAVKISFNPVSLDLLEVQTQAQRIETLKKLRYDEETAKQVAEAIEKSTFFRKPLRVRGVSFQWDVDGGLSITTELQNFVQVDLEDRAA